MKAEGQNRLNKVVLLSPSAHCATWVPSTQNLTYSYTNGEAGNVSKDFHHVQDSFLKGKPMPYAFRITVKQEELSKKTQDLELCCLQKGNTRSTH